MFILRSPYRAYDSRYLLICKHVFSEKIGENIDTHTLKALRLRDELGIKISQSRRCNIVIFSLGNPFAKRPKTSTEPNPSSDKVIN